MAMRVPPSSSGGPPALEPRKTETPEKTTKPALSAKNGWLGNRKLQAAFLEGLTPNHRDNSLNAVEAVATELARLVPGKAFDMYVEAPAPNQGMDNRIIIEAPPDTLEAIRKAMKVSPGAETPSLPDRLPHVPGPTGFYSLNGGPYKDQLMFYEYPQLTHSEVVLLASDGPSNRPNLEEAAKLLQKELGASVVVTRQGDVLTVANTEDSWRMMNVPAVFHGYLVQQRSTYLENRLRVRSDFLAAFRDEFEAAGLRARPDNSPTDFRFSEFAKRDESPKGVLVQPDHSAAGHALRLTYRNGATPENTPKLPETFTDSKGTVWALNKFIESTSGTTAVKNLVGTATRSVEVPALSQQEIGQEIEDIYNPPAALARSVKTAIEKHLTGVVPFDVRPEKNAEGKDVLVVAGPATSIQALKLALLELKGHDLALYQEKLRKAREEYAESNPAWTNWGGSPPMFVPPVRRGFFEPEDSSTGSQYEFVGKFGFATPIILTETAVPKPVQEE